MDIPATPVVAAPIKFNETEIAELASIRDGFDQITLSLGQLEMARRDLKKNEQKLQDRLLALESKEKVFLDGVVAKYGEGYFDIATGIFTPKKV